MEEIESLFSSTSLDWGQILLTYDTSVAVSDQKHAWKTHPVPINISVYAKDYNCYEQIILQNLLIHSKSYVLNVLKYKR